MIGRPSVWHDCYGESWKGIITPESFAHPAKFSKALIERIFDHCLERGWLKRGDLVGDPFGGIGNGGIAAAYRGLRWIGCELEPRFVGFAKANFALHADKWRTMGLPQPEIVRGDSRRFSEAVAGVVTSPPFADSMSDTPSTQILAGSGGRMGASCKGDNYGSSEGQIGRLKSGSVSAFVSSPPYAHITAGAGGLNTKPAKHAGQQSGRNGDAASQTADQRYGQSPGQISGLPEGDVDCVVTSPPFTMAQGGGGGINIKGYGDGSDKVGERTYQGTAGDRSSGNIETLQAGDLNAVVTSPPFEASIGTKDEKFWANHNDQTSNWNGATRATADYGTSEGQIGNDKGETYWQAMAQVYRSCFEAIKPGGVIAIVVKDYVAKKKRVPLCDDTERLLNHIGFVTLERVRASLVREQEHQDLFKGSVTVRRERKSFFRRLAEKKGSPRIDFEEVIIAMRPAV